MKQTVKLKIPSYIMLEKNEAHGPRISTYFIYLFFTYQQSLNKDV